MSTATKVRCGSPYLLVQSVLFDNDRRRVVSVAAEQLGEKMASLAEQGQTISDALDELLTRSWG